MGSQQHRTMFFAICLVFCLVAAPITMQAQGGATGAISGTVQDSSGAVVPNATVQLVSTSTGAVVRTENTNASGLFSFTLLPVDTYTVQVDAPSFAQTTLRNVVVRVTETTRLTVSLKPRSFNEKIEVMAEVAAVKTADATTGESLGGQTIRELPLATRNFQQLLALSAGASSSLNAAAQLGRGDVRINVNGGREDNNNYQIDGIGANDPTNIGELAYTPLPSPDSIQEFKVGTSLYDATQGRNGGGNINAILKSGTTDFHFDVFEYFRNTVLNANDFFLKAQGLDRPVIKQNIFGGSLGGPVGPKAKLGFFFLNYQGTRQRSGDSPGTIISTQVPYVSAADRASIDQLHADCAANLPPIDPVAFKLLAARGNQYGSQAGGFIFPLPTTVPSTTPCGTLVPFALSSPGKFTDDQFTANWDRDFRGGKDRISWRFFFSDSETDQPFGGDDFRLQTGGVPQPSNVNFPMNIPLRNRFGSVSETHIFSNRLVNEFRFGANVIDWRFKTVPILTAQDLGITRPTDNVTNEIYRIFFAGSGFQFGPHPTTPLTNLSDTLSWTDTLSYFRGAHNLRFGTEIVRTSVRKNIPVADNGFLIFIPTPNGDGTFTSDFQNFLIGNLGPGTLADSGVSNHDDRINGFSFFAQDDYRITKTLTLNLGLRTEFQGAPYDQLCHSANIDPSLAATTGQPFVYPRCVNKFNLPGLSGTLERDGLKNNYATVFAPRVGFAYDLFGHQTTAIRGGYGIYTVREDLGGLDNLTLSPPFVPGAAPSGIQQNGLAGFLNGAIPPVGVLSPNFVPQASNVIETFINPATGAPTTDPTQFPIFNGNVWTFFAPVVAMHWIVPTTQQWNLSVQHAFGRGWAFELGYVGTKGTHLREVSDTNQARLASPQNPIVLPMAGGTSAVITQNTQANALARAPFVGLAPFAYEAFNPDSNSHYNGLLATVTHRFSKGLYLQSSYTFSKSIDDTSSSQVAFDSRFNNQLTGQASRGLSDFDHKQRFVTSFSYALPAFTQSKGFTYGAVSGWEIGGVFTLQSGAPFSVIDSAGGTAFGLSSPNLVTPDFAPGFNCSNALTSGSTLSRLNHFINRDAFVNAAVVPNSPDGSTGFGDVPRNCFRGPRQLNLDLSLGKTFRVGEHQSLNFTAEAFNLTNTTTFDSPGPVNDINSGNFGVIHDIKGTPRLFQFALRYSY